MTHISNFRQLGGIPSKFGTVKHNKIYRGGPLTNLNESDVQFIENLNLGNIYDLRSAKEIAQNPNISISNTNYVHLDITRDIHDESADPSDFMKVPSVALIEKHMSNLYADIIDSENSQKCYGKMLNDMSKSSDPLYFHCTAGKDRTGIAGLLILSALGCDLDVIYEDFLKSNDNIDQILVKVTQGFSSADNIILPDESMMKAFLGVKREYLDAAINTINGKYTSIDDYITKQLNVNKEALDQIRRNYLD